jgi:hypothetical protein
VACRLFSKFGSFPPFWLQALQLPAPCAEFALNRVHDERVVFIDAQTCMFLPWSVHSARSGKDWAKSVSLQILVQNSLLWLNTLMWEHIINMNDTVVYSALRNHCYLAQTK